MTGLSFLQPGMLWGAALLLVPLIIHLLNRRRYQRLPWAAMEFLERAFRKVRRRVRLENLLLLLLRCALPIILAIALARPLVEGDSALAQMADAPRHQVMIVDATLSTTQKGGPGGRPIARARQLLTKHLQNQPKTDFQQFSLIRIDTTPQLILHETTDIEQAISSLEKLCQPGFGHSELHLGLDLALDAATGRETSPRFYIFTDLQKVAFGTGPDKKIATDPLADALAKMAKRAGEPPVIIDVGPTTAPANIALTALTAKDPITVKGMPIEFRAQVQNFSAQRKEGQQVIFYLDGERRATVNIDLPPGGKGEATARFTIPLAGPHRVAAEIAGDALDGDNKYHLAMDVREAINVLFVEPRPQPDSRFLLSASGYASRILDPTGPTGSARVTPFTVQEMEFQNFIIGRVDLTGKDVLILAEPPRLSPAAAQVIRDFVNRGGGLMVIPGADTEAASLNLHLAPGEKPGPLPVRLRELKGYTKREDGCFFPSPQGAAKHPVLADLAGQLSTILTGTPVYRFMQAAPTGDGTQVVLSLDDDENSPLLAVKRFGRGRVIYLASPIRAGDKRWNELSAPFLAFPLLHQCARFLTDSRGQAFNLTVGAPLIPRFNSRPHEIRITPPGGRSTLLPGKARPTPDGRWQFAPWPATAKPGIYRLDLAWEGSSKTGQWPYCYAAATVDNKESDLDRFTQETLKKRLPNAPYHLRRDLAGTGKDIFTTPGGDIGFNLLFLVLGLLVLEGLLAALFGRSRK